MAFDLLPDFYEKPAGTSFIEQEHNEQIDLLLRRHWVTNLPWMIMTSLGILAPALLVSLEQFFGLNLISQLPSNIFLGLLIIWDLFIFAYAIQSLMYWYFNIYIVTNLHIVEITFVPPLSKEVLQARLDDIQSVRSKVSGFIQSSFNYGAVIIETAGPGEDMIFNDVPTPDVVVDRIQKLQEPQERGPKDVG